MVDSETMPPRGSPVPQQDNPLVSFGANDPPLDPPPAEPEQEDTVEDELAKALAPFVPRIEVLADRASSLSQVIGSDVDQARAVEVIRDARKLHGEVEDKRVDVKAPYLAAVKIVDAGFGAPKTRLQLIADRIEKRASDYDRAKAAAARREAEEVARKAREEELRRAEAAERAVQEGRAAHAAIHLQKADAAQEQAARATAAARASSVDLTRTRSEGGAVSSGRTVWAGEITDVTTLDLNVLRPYFTRADLQKALDTFVRTTCRGEMTAPVVAGARIFSDVRTRVR